MIKTDSLDAFHSNYIAPLGIQCKSIVTIHDILYESHAKYFSLPQILRNRVLIRHTAHTAVQVHTVSNYSRTRLIETYGIPPEKIKIVANGVDHSVFCPSERDVAKHNILNKFGVSDFILTVGRLEPRKNHLGLLKAYIILRRKHPNLGPLVIVGQRDFGYRDFFNYLEDSGIDKHVKILETVDDRLLPEMLKAAKLFVYPSFAEGFGIPPLEAMACGTPVVCSNKTALPEVVGTSAKLFDPDDINALVTCMDDFISSETVAQQFVAKGLVQSKQWSWENAAKAYLQAISEIG